MSLLHFDERAFGILVDEVQVKSKTEIVLEFMDRTDITVQ